MNKQDVVCLLGNAGSGKSSLCELINSRNENIIAIERDDQLAVKHEIDLNVIDQLTLEHPFDHQNFNKIILPDQTTNQERIYWIVLDCQVDTILKRIASRASKDAWTTRKALFYFQQRYRHLSAHFGIPLIDTTHQSLEQISQQIFHLIGKQSNCYQYYRRIGTQLLNYDLIQQYDLENQLTNIISTDHFDQIANLPEYAQEFNDIDQQKLYIRWYVNNHSIEVNHEKSHLQIGDYQLAITGPIFRLITEGESKKIYRDISGNPWTEKLAFIVLKSTIYSHSRQITGEITSLGSIRACGSQIFLEMMWRNDLKHVYRSINTQGIIISDFLSEITPIEVIVKRYCEGTDKNSFYQICNHEDIVVPNTNGEYRTGPYVRLDWRNPNHLSPKTMKALHENPYYYLYEQIVGKEEFFKRILTNQ